MVSTNRFAVLAEPITQDRKTSVAGALAESPKSFLSTVVRPDRDTKKADGAEKMMEMNKNSKRGKRGGRKARKFTRETTEIVNVETAPVQEDEETSQGVGEVTELFPTFIRISSSEPVSPISEVEKPLKETKGEAPVNLQIVLDLAEKEKAESSEALTIPSTASTGPAVEELKASSVLDAVAINESNFAENLPGIPTYYKKTDAKNGLKASESTTIQVLASLSTKMLRDHEIVAEEPAMERGGVPLLKKIRRRKRGGQQANKPIPATRSEFKLDGLHVVLLMVLTSFLVMKLGTCLVA